MTATVHTLAVSLPQQTCTKCGEAKPQTATYFSRHCKSKTGFNWWCKACEKTYAKAHGSRVNKRWYVGHAEQKRAYARAWREALRLEVLQHYSSSSTPYCACCRTPVLEFLALDHIEGGGTRHRRSFKSNSSVSVYSWVKKNGFPSGFRVLCHNCNQAFGAYGYCPHQRREGV